MPAKASKAQGVSATYTSIHVIGGIQVDCERMLPHKYVDIKTEGAAMFGGNVKVMQNMCVMGTVMGTFEGDFSGNLIGDVVVEGDLDVAGNLTVLDALIANLVVDMLCVTDTLKVDRIEAKTSANNIVIVGNLIPEPTMMFNLGSPTNKWGTTYTNDLVVMGNITANVIIGNTLTYLSSSGSFGSESLVDSGVGPFLSVKGLIAGAGIILTPVANSDIIITSTGGGGGNAWVGNATSDLNMHFYSINNVDVMNGNIVSVSQILETDRIEARTAANTIVVLGNLLPDETMTYDLGSLAKKWNTMYTNDLVVMGTITANVIIGNNVVLLSSAGSLGSESLVSDGVGPFLSTKGLIAGSGIALTPVSNTDIIITSTVVSGWVGNATSNLNMNYYAINNVDTVIANVVTTTQYLETDRIEARTSANTIVVLGNLLPDETMTYDLGSLAKKWNTVYTNDLVVMGNITANVIIGNTQTYLSSAGSLGSESLVNSGVGPFLSTKGLIAGSGITLTPVSNTDIIITSTGGGGNSWVGNATSNLYMHYFSVNNVNIITANIIDATISWDYKRTVVSGLSHVITQTDDILAVTASAFNISATLTLPLISTLQRKRKKFTIVDEGGKASLYPIIIQTTGPNTIFSGPSWMLDGDYNSASLYCDESNQWFVL